MFQYKYTIHLRIKQQATGQIQTLEVPGMLDSKVKLKIDLHAILATANDFISKLQFNHATEYDPKKQFYTIFIRTDTGFANIYKVMMNPRFKVYYQTSDSQQKIYLDLRLQPFRHNSDKNSEHCVLTNYEKRIQNVQSNVLKLKNKLIQDFNKMSDQQKRPYDLVYLFSQPLLRQRNNEAETEVSYVKEYQSFIRVFKTEAPARHVRVKMMVATQENIKQILNEGVNILHFSSHGSQDQLHLQCNLGSTWIMNSQNLIQMLTNAQQKPNLIVLNACYSRTMAQKVFQRLKNHDIATIGYQGKALDQYCQFFTEKFYSQAFKNENKSIQYIVSQIKWNMHQKNQKQSQKLNLFASSQKQSQPVFKGFGLQFRMQGSLQYEQLLSLGSDQEPLGIKTQLHKLIKILSIKQKEIFFLMGDQRLGKTVLIQKAVRYMRQRQAIDDFFTINFREAKKAMHSVLMFDLQFRDQVEFWIKDKQKKRQHNLVIILDHCDELMKFQTFNFLQYIRKSFFKSLKGNSKIVFVSNQVYHVNNPHNFKQISKIIEKEPFKPTILPFKRFLTKWNKDLSDSLQGEQLQTFYKQLQKLCNNPYTLTMAFTSFKTAPEVLQYLTIIKKSDLKGVQKKFISLQHEAPWLNQILDETNKRLKSSICSGKYKYRGKYFIIVNFLDLFDQVEMIEMQHQVYQSFWNDQLKGVSKFIKECLEAQNNSVKVNTFIQICLGFIIKIPNYCLILGRWSDLRSQILSSLTIIERMQYRFNYTIQMDNDLKNRIRSLKLRLLIVAKCIFDASFQNPQLLNQEDKQNFGRCIMRQIEKTETYKFEGEDQMQAIRTALQLNMMISDSNHYQQNGFGDKLVKDQDIMMYPQQEDQQNYSSLNKSYYQLNNELEKYYHMVEILQRYNSSSRNQVKFYTQVELSTMYIIGIRFIEVLLKEIYDKKLHVKVDMIREKLEHIGCILTEFFGKRLRKAKDKSFSDLYINYTKSYVICRFKLQQICVRQQNNSSFPLQVYEQLKKRCREVKMNHLMIEIQNHMMQNFSNICVTLISQPLSYYKKKSQGFSNINHLSSKNSQANKIQKSSYINLIRNECEIETLIKNTFNEINKQIYVKILNLTYYSLGSLQANTPLIYTLICDCAEFCQGSNIKRRVIFVEDYERNLGSSTGLSLQMIQFAAAPVIIACGSNVHFIHQSYRNKNSHNIKSAFICFNQPQYNYIRKGSFEVLLHEQYKTFITKKIANFIFSTFYKAFCTNFFNDNHENFKKQVVNSFQIARLKAQIEAKISFSKDEMTNQIINQLMQNLTIDITGIDQRQGPVKMKNGKCIYHPSIRQKILPQKVYQSINEIGYNQVISECLHKIFKSKQKHIFIRSDTPSQTLKFLRMLIFKINKIQKFCGQIHYLNKANCTDVQQYQFQQQVLVKRDSFDRQANSNSYGNQQFDHKIFIYDQTNTKFTIDHMSQSHKLYQDLDNKKFLFILNRSQMKQSKYSRDCIDIQNFFIEGKSEQIYVDNQIIINIVSQIYQKVAETFKLNMNSVLKDQYLIKNLKNFNFRNEVKSTIHAKIKKMISSLK